MSLPRRCTVCRRTGHMARAHNDLSPEALAALKADGLEYMGRGFRELGEVHPGGDLLDQLRADTEAADLAESMPGTRDLLGALQDSVDRARAGRAVVSPVVSAGPDENPQPNDVASVTPECPACGYPEDAHATGCPRLAWPLLDDDPAELTIVPMRTITQAEEDADTEAWSPSWSPADCQQCGAALTNGESFLCDRCVYSPDSDPELVGQALTEVITASEQQIARAFRVPGHLMGSTAALGEQGPQFAPWRTPLGPDGPLLITLPGVYDLTAEQYHDVAITGDWFSNSDAKKLLKTCPAQFDYDRQNGVRKTSDAFDFGHVWHAVILGKGEAYEVFEPKKLDGRTKEGKAQKRDVDAARAAGRTPIYGDQFALIEAMAEAVEANQVAHDLLTQPGRSEVCLFWREHVRITDPKNRLFGQVVEVQRRAMIDRLPDMPADRSQTVTLVDGKTADEVKPDDDLRKKIYDYGYHRQADTYQMAVMALFGVDADVVLLFQSKKPPHLIVPVDLDTPAMRVAAAENHQAMQTWAECVATGEWPEYTKGIATSGVPAWIERQFEDEMA